MSTTVVGGGSHRQRIVSAGHFGFRPARAGDAVAFGNSGQEAEDRTDASNVTRASTRSAPNAAVRAAA